MTYNHKPYILDALHGFVIQQTDFPFVAMVMDDASTDGEPEVLRKYIAQQCAYASLKTEDNELYELIEADAKDNPNCHFAFYFLKRNLFNTNKKEPISAQWEALAEYTAICEGDDYWTDSLKLQKQVDILEADDTLIGVCTNRCLVDFHGNVYEGKCNDTRYFEGRITLRDFFAKNLSYTSASVLFRNSHMEERWQKIGHMRNPYLLDWTLWIALHCFGDFYYLDDVTCAYRNNPTSVTHTMWRNDAEGRAKLDFYLLPRVADILPDEYADIAAKLRKPDWVYIRLIKVYMHNRKPFKMLWAVCMSLIKCPKTFISSIGQRLKRVNRVWCYPR